MLCEEDRTYFTGGNGTVLSRKTAKDKSEKELNLVFSKDIFWSLKHIFKCKKENKKNLLI